MIFFAVSDNKNLRQLRHVFGIASVQTMIENRRRKFLDYFLNVERFTVVFSVVTFNMTCAFSAAVWKLPSIRFGARRTTRPDFGVEQIRAS